MTSLYGSASESYPFARDFVSCDATGIAEVDCPRRQYATFYVSNPNLQPETSESINMGLVWSPSFMAGNQSFSLDYYEITFEDLQSRVTLQALINAERAGNLAAVTGNTGAVLNRAANGKLSSASFGNPSFCFCSGCAVTNEKRPYVCFALCLFWVPPPSKEGN